MKTNMKTLSQYVTETGFTIDSGLVLTKTDYKNLGNFGNAFYYKCKIYNPQNRKSITFPFAKGKGLNGSPTIHETLGCLIMDAQCTNDSVEGFCNDMGYKPREGKRLYKLCLKTAEKLERLLGEQYAEIVESYEIDLNN